MITFSPAISTWLRSISYGTLGIVIGLCVVLAWLQHVNNDQPIPEAQAVIAKPSKAVKNTPKIDAVVKKPVKVYKGGAALKDGLKLPQNVISDDREQVIASSEVKNDDHPHTITTTINTETGESETYIKSEPLPWLSFDKRGSVGLYYGFKSTGQAARLEARQDLFDIKSIRCGGVASVDSDSQYFAGIGCSYNW